MKILKNLTTSIFCLLIIVALLTTLTSSCQHKKQDKEMNEPKFEYEGNICSPLGYPIDVYEGGLESSSGSTSLYLGVTTGRWGSNGGGMSHSEKAVPKRLNVTWLAYAEDTFYTIDCDIDYDKMLRLFKEGYQDRMWFLNDGRYQTDTFNAIVVGFAPGGVVVIWLNGAGMQVEIGRYQGKKIVIPQSEIGGLDNHERLLFDPEYRKETMLNKEIVPIEIQEANKNKPIPYGLWDSYRKRYSWRPIFTQNTFGDSTMTVIFTRLDMFNGEFGSLFDQSLVDNEFIKQAVPKRVNFGWKDKKGQVYSGTLNFDEKEIFDAYKEIYKEDDEALAELVFQINIPNTFITVMLKSKDKEVHINKGTKVEVFKSDRKF
ncbi:DUF2931 family protein [Flavobacterium sp. AJR]|uniref:DUF2931 family protein n=1 Tax=Flavobacterium sp. AJR TaxID=1979369 RepID=UPI000A3D82A7|nr:DUF2931 family protein [Flavobacterium sp. AJR]OUL60270.1 hypothetical protein B8T70_21280 [Flavobacterium sp. AJR]